MLQLQQQFLNGWRQNTGRFLIQVNVNIQVFFHLQHILTCLSLLSNLLGLIPALITSYKRRKAREILVMLILRRTAIVKSLGLNAKKPLIHKFSKRTGTTNAWWEKVINDKVIAETKKGFFTRLRFFSFHSANSPISSGTRAQTGGNNLAHSIMM